MTRYLYQPCNFSCSPTALLNAAKWAGKRYTKKDIDYFKGMCHFLPKEGTEEKYFHLAMQALSKYHKFFDAKLIKEPTTSLIDKHISKGGAVILKYGYYCNDEKEDVAHHSLIVGKKDEEFICINDEYKKSVYYRSKKFLSKRLRYKKKMFRPYAYFLFKKEAR